MTGSLLRWMVWGEVVGTGLSGRNTKIVLCYCLEVCVVRWMGRWWVHTIVVRPLKEKLFWPDLSGRITNIYLSIYLSVKEEKFRSEEISPILYLSIELSIHLSINISIYLSICISIYLEMTDCVVSWTGRWSAASTSPPSPPAARATDTAAGTVTTVIFQRYMEKR